MLQNQPCSYSGITPPPKRKPWVSIWTPTHVKKPFISRRWWKILFYWKINEALHQTHWCVCVGHKHQLHTNLEGDHAVVVSQLDWWWFHIRLVRLQAQGSSTLWDSPGFHNTGTGHLSHRTRDTTRAQPLYWWYTFRAKGVGVGCFPDSVSLLRSADKAGRCAFGWDGIVNAAGRTTATSNRVTTGHCNRPRCAKFVHLD